MINEKHGHGTHSTKMGANKLAENHPNASKLIGPKCLLKPKSLRFRQKKVSLGVRSPWPKVRWAIRVVSVPLMEL